MPRKARGDRRAFSGRTGAILVETTLILPVFILIISGMVDLAVLLRQSDVVTEAARHAGRALAADTGRHSLCLKDNPPPIVNCSPLPDPSTGHTEKSRAELRALRAACAYIKFSRLQISDWAVELSYFQENPISTNGITTGNILYGTVRIREISPNRSWKRWADFFRNTLVGAEVTFAEQVVNCV
jgi:hypothetical protein